MRRGFSLITAIVFIVLIATIGALALSFSTLNVKQTSDTYLREQAELLVQSGTEYALLAISAHEINATNGCLNTINAQFPNTATPLFDINISINYLGIGLPASNVARPCQKFSESNISTIDSNVTVIIDTIVELTPGNNISTEPIRLHRRTIQKP
ncbi:type II secretion system protein [Sulfurospirillum sp.]|uniref:type II secretion system protein n=1 Tax=Sulfurospirillum sp. TaxID=2053622 RepID=UPI002FDD0E2B